MSFKSLAVFCGSKQGSNPLYAEHAKQLGYLLAENNITLIYGGSCKGIMGTVADAVLEKKGKAIGIMPTVLVEWEIQHRGLTELHEVANMHERKAMIYEKCEAAIILPGGYGTLDEFFEMITWNQLDIHDKKIFVLNTSGFYDHLLQHLTLMENEQFLYDKVSEKLKVINTPAELFF